MRESIGFGIVRSEKGAIRFQLNAAVDYNLEYHPFDSLPSSYEAPLTGDPIVMASWAQLEENWYLVRYSDN